MYIFHLHNPYGVTSHSLEADHDPMESAETVETIDGFLRSFFLRLKKSLDCESS